MKQAGFTIIELMFAVAIGGVLLALALPSYDSLLRNNCRTTAANALVTSLQQARSEAVKLRLPVSVAASDTANDGNEWGSGWTVFQDADADGALDAGEEIRVTALTCELPAAGVNQQTISAEDDDGDVMETFTYQPTGFIVTAGTIDICHEEETGERGRRITILRTGRPSMDSDFACP